MDSIIGLVIIYAWVHSLIITYSKTKDCTPYERTVLIVGAVGFTLFVIGTIYG